LVASGSRDTRAITYDHSAHRHSQRNSKNVTIGHATAVYQIRTNDIAPVVVWPAKISVGRNAPTSSACPPAIASAKIRSSMARESRKRLARSMIESIAARSTRSLWYSRTIAPRQR